jgi:hypothetical protein
MAGRPFASFAPAPEPTPSLLAYLASRSRYYYIVDMNGRAWRWALNVFVTCWVIALAIRAFSVPWRGDFNQWLTILFAAIAVLALSQWGIIWFRGGTEGVRAKRREMTAPRPPQSRAQRAINLTIWIGVAVALVIYFNFHQNH